VDDSIVVLCMHNGPFYVRICHNAFSAFGLRSSSLLFGYARYASLRILTSVQLVSPDAEAYQTAGY
jgi:hypothetical protein